MEYKSLQMIPVATVSVLRTTEIVIAFVANVALTQTVPEYTDIIGSSLVFFAALSLIFEERLSKFMPNINCRVSDDNNDKPDV